MNNLEGFPKVWKVLEIGGQIGMMKTTEMLREDKILKKVPGDHMGLAIIVTPGV